MSLQGLKRKFPRIHSHDARIVLEARNLSTARGLKNVSLQLHKGEVLGIAGRLGSGRTALARALFGIDPLTAGQITINGTTVKFRTPSDAVKARIGYISDSEYEECLFHNFSIAENITIASLKDISSFKHLNLVYERFIAEQFQKKLLYIPAMEVLKSILCQTETGRRYFFQNGFLQTAEFLSWKSLLKVSTKAEKLKYIILLTNWLWMENLSF